ncbi:MAG: hypothetical protein LBH84_03870 [Prevotellaceae bacterium]|jgi:hypothetical protein|nr:hypothetical protein [Prevotellaceae bacterium]
MKRFFLILLSTLVVTSAGAQSRKERKALFGSSYNYEIAVLGVGQDGTKVFKVWGYDKKVDKAIVQAKKNAVAACIFRGIPGGNGAAPTPAICRETNAEETHADYFNDFFETGGKYLKYVNLTTDAVPSGQDRLKVKGGYKVGIAVQILYDNLRRDLEADGIARRLDAGF